MRLVVPLVFVALCACENVQVGQTSTTYARVPASPSPVTGPRMNSYAPLPTLPQQQTTVPSPASPPPGTSVITVPPTREARDNRITESIRKSIAADDSLSPTAKAVEVITKNRKVILKGIAHSEQERMNIDRKARATD